MSETSATSEPTTSKASRRRTSAAVSRDGPTLFDWLDGPSPDPCGQSPAHARRFRKQAEKSDARSAQAACLCRALDELASSCAQDADTPGTPTSGTSGPKYGGSSETHALQLCLESKCRERMDLSGSLEYELHWKSSATVLGPSICRLRASARRTSAREFFGWPSPTAESFEPMDAEKMLARRERIKAQGINGNGFGLSLAMSAHLVLSSEPSSTSMATGPDHAPIAEPSQESDTDLIALVGWPTPDSSHHGTTTPEKALRRVQGKGKDKRAANLDDIAVLTGWATPMGRDGRSEEVTDEFTTERWSHPRGKPLSTPALTVAGWATPTSTDGSKAHMTYAGKNLSLVGMALGTITASCSVATPTGTADPRPAGFRLNWAFSRWLQGFPPAWDESADCVGTGTA